MPRASVVLPLPSSPESETNSPGRSTSRQFFAVTKRRRLVLQERRKFNG